MTQQPPDDRRPAWEGGAYFPPPSNLRQPQNPQSPQQRSPFNPQFPSGQYPPMPQQGSPQGYPQQQPQGYPQQQNYQQFPQQLPQGYPQQQNYQQFPQQPSLMQPPTPSKKRGKGWLIVGVIAAVLVFGCIGSALVSHNGTTTTTTTASTLSNSDSATQASTTAPTPVPTKAPVQKWTTTHTFSGNGTKKTESFAVGEDWKLLWKCDPASSYGGQYNVIITPTGTDNVPIDSGVNSMCQTGSTSGETEIRQSGTIYLDVISEGQWNVTIQELR